MAGDWIKMRVDLADDPAVIGIAARLGLDEFAVVGRLQSLWAWADGQSRDGHAAGVTAAWVNRKLQCDGFAEAMADVGWLSVDNSGITLPNFANHNGETAKTRALGKNRQQKARGNADVTPTVTPASRQERDESVTREEKRREEISTDVLMPSAGEICKAMKTAGLVTGVSPSHPKLLALIAAGVTVDEFTDAAKEAVTRQKPFAYALATAEGRRRDAATEPLPAAAAIDPDSMQAVIAEGVAKGIGPWNEINEQWHIYKARVRGNKQPGLSLEALAGMAQQRQGVH